jgi:hypothetical protein
MVDTYAIPAGKIKKKDVPLPPRGRAGSPGVIELYDPDYIYNEDSDNPDVRPEDLEKRLRGNYANVSQSNPFNILRSLFKEIGAERSKSHANLYNEFLKDIGEIRRRDSGLVDADTIKDIINTNLIGLASILPGDSEYKTERDLQDFVRQNARFEHIAKNSPELVPYVVKIARAMANGLKTDLPGLVEYSYRAWPNFNDMEWNTIDLQFAYEGQNDRKFYLSPPMDQPFKIIFREKSGYTTAATGVSKPVSAKTFESVTGLKYTGFWSDYPQEDYLLDYILIWQFSKTDEYTNLKNRVQKAREKTGDALYYNEYDDQGNKRTPEPRTDAEREQAGLNAFELKQALANGTEIDEENKEELRRAFLFHNQRLLAQNVVTLARHNHQMRGLQVPAYKNIHLVDGPPFKLMNALTYRPNMEKFTEITVPEASSLVPLIKLFKVDYDQKGKVLGQTLFKFDTFLNLNNGPKSAVGIKSFDWQLNGTNMASVKSDITATLVLYFQSFDELLRTRYHGGKAYRYIDLLTREDTTRGDNAETNIDSQNSTKINDSKQQNDDPKFYEIKAEVGWAYNNDYILDYAGNAKLEKALKSQRMHLFLGLKEHTFDIEQDGTFTLTINYQARTNAMLFDHRTDILQTLETKRQLGIKTSALSDAENQDPDRAKKIKEEIKQIKDEQRHLSNADILTKLLTSKKIFSGYITKRSLEAVAYDLNKLTPDRLNLIDPKQQTIIQTQQDLLNKARDKAFQGANAGFLQSQGSVVLTEGQCDFFGGGVTMIGAGAVAGGISQAVEYFTEEDPSPDLKEWDNTCFNAGFVAADGNSETNAYIQPDPFADFEGMTGLTRDGDRYYIHYFFLGDLIDIATDKAFELLAADEDKERAAFNQGRSENIKIILGSIGINSLSHEAGKIGSDIVNIADIPVSLELYRDFWARRVTKAKLEEYPLNKFIKDTLKDFVLECIGHRNFDGERAENLVIRDGSLLLPAKKNGKNRLDPIKDRILSSMKTPASEAWTNAGIKDPKNTLTFGSRIHIKHLRNPPLMTNNNANLSVDDAYHYKVFYVQNVVTPEMNGNRNQDIANGIMHLALGQDRGLVKSARFNREATKGIREQRVLETNKLDPLNYLADVYNIDLTLFGNTIFWPGQYIFFNPLGFGTKFGLPTDQGSISRQMGLGGYHLVNKVECVVENGNFETTISARFDNSGGPGAKSVSLANKNRGKPDSVDTAELTADGTPNSTIEGN